MPSITVANHETANVHPAAPPVAPKVIVAIAALTIAAVTAATQKRPTSRASVKQGRSSCQRRSRTLPTIASTMLARVKPMLSSVELPASTLATRLAALARSRHAATCDGRRRSSPARSTPLAGHIVAMPSVLRVSASDSAAANP